MEDKILKIVASTAGGVVLSIAIATLLVTGIGSDVPEQYIWLVGAVVGAAIGFLQKYLNSKGIAKEENTDD